MKHGKIPKTDSIKKLAQFWDSHDLTDFEPELEEVTQALFERNTVIPLALKKSEAKAVRKLAQTKGVPDAELIRTWVREKLRMQSM